MRGTAAHRARPPHQVGRILPALALGASACCVAVLWAGLALAFTDLLRTLILLQAVAVADAPPPEWGPHG